MLRAKAGDFAKGFKDAEKSADSGAKGILRSMNSLKAGMTAIWAFIAAHIVAGAGKAALAMAELAGRGDGLRRAFSNLATSAGESSDRILAALRRGTAGTVSDFKLIQEANRALISGLPASAEKMEELAKVARGLGQAVGIDATEAISRLVRGISKQEIELLDELFGGSIKFIDVIRQLGPTATATEKSMAIYNAVLETGKKRVEEMGGVQETFADQLGRARAQIDNFKESLGRKLIPVIETLIPLALTAAEALGKLFGVEDISADPLVGRVRQIQAQMAALGKQIDEARAGGAPGFVVHEMEQQWERLSREQAQVARQFDARERAAAAARKARQDKERRDAEKSARAAREKADRASFEARLGEAKLLGQMAEEQQKARPRGMAATPEERRVERFFGGAPTMDPQELVDELVQGLETVEEKNFITLEKQFNVQSDTREIIQELTTMFDARTNRLIDGIFRAERAIDRLPNSLSKNLGRVPGLGGLGDTFKTGANIFMAGMGIFQAASAGIGILKSIGGFLGIGKPSGPAYPDFDQMTEEDLRKEIERLSQYGNAQKNIGLINTFTAQIEQLRLKRQQEGSRTFSSVATLTEATGHQMVANLTSILSELQNGHLLAIRDMLAAGIKVSASGLTQGLAADAYVRRRSAGL